MKKIPKEKVFEQIERQWYAQGFNCAPLFLSSCALSGFDLNKTLASEFKSFLFDYKKDWGKMYYSIKDLERLAGIILKNLKKDKDFFKKAKKAYEKDFEKSMIFFKSLDDKELSDLSEEELIKFFKKASFYLRSAVGGWGHIIEPFALTMDNKIRDMLAKHVKDSGELNNYLSTLLTPAEKSFINERQEDLYNISLINDKEKKQKRIKKHLEKFFWIRNSYAGRRVITPEDIKEEIKNIEYKPIDTEKIKRQKNKLAKKLNLSGQFIMLMEIFDFLAIWQDERKKNILITIDYADRILEEISRRLNIDHKYLRYLSFYESQSNWAGKSNLEDMLKERIKGCIHYATGQGEAFLVGREYAKFHKEMGKKEKALAKSEDLHGVSASSGTAIGRAKICKNIKDINNFKKEEILISSMTRPEFFPAMRKAAAIVTDEGGITCHAAIVSRELNIPCVIGTKTATSDIKDGDLVEIKANHGLVKIINKK